MSRLRLGAVAVVLGLVVPAAGAEVASGCGRPYCWQQAPPAGGSLEARIPPPQGFQRVRLDEGSFAAWLRGLPLLAGCPPVHLHDGSLKGNQRAHVAVLDLDVGRRDLQQCADAVIRLRAEYLFACGRAAEVAFDFTSGDRAAFAQWADGWRTDVRGSRVHWVRSARPDGGYASFRRYLDVVMTYAGTASLARELRPVPDTSTLQPGDVWIQGGFPGHAVLVVDVAVEPATGRKVFLLLQSYSPAQEVHLLQNPSDDALSPWYRLAAGDDGLLTPEWTFPRGSLRRFPGDR